MTAESDALLTASNNENDKIDTSRGISNAFFKIQNKKKIITILSILIVISLTFQTNPQSQGSPFHKRHSNTHKKKNVIFFVTDGMGPASLSLTRSYKQFIETGNNSIYWDDSLPLDKYLVGTSRTRSFDSLVTDSAAGATAFACALKTYNGAIGVDHDRQPCGTLLEAAKLNDMLTGLVVTTRITDATPAAFSSHADFRTMEDLIALHQLGQYELGEMVDLMIGGGRTHFYPPGNFTIGNKGSRLDNRNLIAEIVAKNKWQYVNNRHEFDQLRNGTNVTLPLLALLADYDIPFEIDRDAKIYPSLEEGTITAINALSEATKDSDKGFFLMVEGSRIDHAGHQNDPAAQVEEILAFNKAFEAAVQFADNSDVETILISTSDHETGGLAVSRQVTKEYPEYLWYPAILANSTHSGEFLAEKIHSFNQQEHKREDRKKFIQLEIFKKQLGVLDYTEDEVNGLLELNDESEIQYFLNNMISLRAQIGWSTHGHSAVDVNIYAYTNNRNTWFEILDKLQGNHENIEIGSFIADYLQLDLDEVTKQIANTTHKGFVESKLISDKAVFDEYNHKLN